MPKGYKSNQHERLRPLFNELAAMKYRLVVHNNHFQVIEAPEPQQGYDSEDLPAASDVNGKIVGVFTDLRHASTFLETVRRVYLVDKMSQVKELLAGHGPAAPEPAAEGDD